MPGAIQRRTKHPTAGVLEDVATVRLRQCMCLLFPLLILPIVHGNVADLRGSSKTIFSLPALTDEIYQSAKLAIQNATPQSLAAIRNDDPLLAVIYYYRAGTQGSSPQFDTVEADMFRRGDVAIQLLVGLFKNPIQESTRGKITGWVWSHSWMKPEVFRPLILDWYRELKAHGMTIEGVTILRFLVFWGYPEDEEIVKDLAQSLSREKWAMPIFRERIERIRNGDTASIPYFPEFSSDWSTFSQNLSEEVEAKNQAATAQSSLESVSRPKAKPPLGILATQSTANLTPWIVCGLPAVALVWLVLWFKRKKIR